MPKIAVPSLNMRRYAETFAVFVEHSLEYSQMLDELVRVTHKYLRDGFRLLDIGAGTGLLIRSWLELAGSIRPGRYVAFEPNPQHVERLLATVAELGVDHDIQARPFTLDTPLLKEFDMVLFSHSLYWMPDPALHMLHSASALVSGGVALAFLGGPYGVHAMFPLFEPLIERTSPMLQNNSISSHELVHGLRAYGVEPEVRILPTPIDLTGLFEPAAAPQLAEFISFCMQLEFTRLPAWLQADMIQYVQGGCVTQNGRLYWYLPTASVLLSLLKG
jgi:SAM-dependent methyltransferase